VHNGLDWTARCGHSAELVPDPTPLVRRARCCRGDQRAGASCFLLKNVPPEQLVDGIRAIASRDALLAPSITRRVIEEFVRRPPEAARTPPPELAELTEREHEVQVLTHLARGLSNAEIAKALFVSDTTVKTHVARILMKLRLRDRVQAVVFAYESGLVQPGAE
jgi:DNA-binding NarL/FixJ family response regulator